ncbi:MAG: diguanylate cyclase [Firmicutes bacterium]|nr:diguanylate cyclase [Bacillota bacterium]
MAPDSEKDEVLVGNLLLYKGDFSSTPYLKNILGKLRESVNADAVSLFILNSTQCLTIAESNLENDSLNKLEKRTVRAGSGACGKSMETCTSVHFEKLPEDFSFKENGLEDLPVKSLICVPLSGSEGVLGSIEILKITSTGNLTAENLNLAQSFASWLTLGIENSRLKNKVSHYLQEFDRKDFDLYTLHQVSKALSSILDLEELVNLTTDMLSEVMTVDMATVMLLNEEEDQLVIKNAKSLDPSLVVPEFTLKIGEGLSDWIDKIKGENIPIRNFDEPDFVKAFPDAHQQLNRHGLKVMTPMIHKYKLVGALVLGHKYTGETLQDRDFDYLATLASLAANAISNAQLYELAILDGTTRLFMARYFRQRCQEELKRATRYNKPLSLIMFDIDFFKRVNDNYGHLAGDHVLREVALIIKKSIRQDVDIAARYGGEEFVILSPETTKEGALILAERIRTGMEQFPFVNGVIHLTISGGISCFPSDAKSYSDLVEKADIQLYRAKRTGRNKICLATADSLGTTLDSPGFFGIDKSEKKATESPSRRPFADD